MPPRRSRGLDRALVLYSAGGWPLDDAVLALLSAGLQVVAAPAEALSRLDGESFDVVVLDAGVLRLALLTRVSFRALVLVGRDSPFGETPALMDLLDAAVDRDAGAALYWVSCPEAFACLPASGRLSPFFLRCPTVPGRVLRPPVLREIAPAERDALFAPVAPPPVAGRLERVLFRGAFLRPTGPLAEQPATGSVDVAELRDIAGALFERDRCYLPKARCMARLLEAHGLRWPDDHRSWRGLAELFRRIDMMNVRLPLVRALARAFGDRFALHGPGWSAAGLAASGPAPGPGVSVCVDLGSSRIDGAWHRRPREILAGGGVLLRPDRPDGDAVFGSAAPLFRTEAELLAAADALLSGRTVVDMEAVRAHVGRVLDPASAGAALRDVLERAVAGRPPARLRLGLTGGPGWPGDLVRRQRIARRPRDCLATSLELMAAGGRGWALVEAAASSIAALVDDAPLAAVDRLPETAACDPATRLKLAAAVAILRGDDAAMEAHARDSLALRADDTLITAVARRRMPGPGYVAWLGHLHRRLRPAVYLEIGIMHGVTLALAGEGTVAVGVDPVPLLPAERPAHWRVFPVTSDAFFAARPFAGELAPPDLVFLDGLHLFEQTLRDFVNAERIAHAGTVLCIHDCVPFDARTARRRRATDFWTGDVWKVVPILLEHRPDLTVTVIPASPTGLVMVTGLDPASTVLEDRFDAVVAAWRRRRFSPAVMRGWPFVANSRNAAEPALAARGEHR